MNKKFSVWEGVYPSFSSIKNKEGEAFSSDKWIDNINSVIDMKKGVVLDIKDKHDVITNDYPVLLLLAILSATKKVKMLDYGGGITSLYVYIDKLLQNNNYEVDVYDNEKLCIKAREVFGYKDNLRFIFEQDKIADKYDLIHAGSSIQYIENWKSILDYFEKLQPEYIVLSDVPAGEISTFATAQNYYGEVIPCWFFNVDEICNSFKKYKLIFKQNYRSKILGKAQKLPMDNFQEENKIDYAVNMIFKHV